MIGTKFGRLTVTEITNEIRGNKQIYKCVCDCGNFVFTDKYKLKDGHTKSCGCFKLDVLKKRKFKHGLTGTPEYKSWSEMKQRCLNPSNISYKNYGGRGITVCGRWIDSFENFLLDMGCRPTKNHSLDRIDFNAGYSPDNCKWATDREQQSNRRDTTKFVYKGQLMALSHIAEAEGIPQSTMQRLVVGKKMTIEQAIATRR